MRVSFDLNVKAVLAVVAVSALCVVSFYAGEWHQAHKAKAADAYAATSDDPYAAIAVDIIPDGTTAETWCNTHPNTKWTYGSAKPDPSDRYHLSDGLVPKHGGCDQKGQAWVISDKDEKPDKPNNPQH